LFPIVNFLKWVVRHNAFQDINNRKQRGVRWDL